MLGRRGRDGALRGTNLYYVQRLRPARYAYALGRTKIIIFKLASYVAGHLAKYLQSGGKCLFKAPATAADTSRKDEEV